MIVAFGFTSCLSGPELEKLKVDGFGEKATVCSKGAYSLARISRLSLRPLNENSGVIHDL